MGRWSFDPPGYNGGSAVWHGVPPAEAARMAHLDSGVKRDEHAVNVKKA
ncbi:MULTISPECIES: hypothetical protein [unclassified Hyphomonas]|nr:MULTISPECIES: hypothetical protein [unclassified Hyphomonas]